MVWKVRRGWFSLDADVLRVRRWQQAVAAGIATGPTGVAAVPSELAATADARPCAPADGQQRR